MNSLSLSHTHTHTEQEAVDEFSGYTMDMYIQGRLTEDAQRRFPYVGDRDR
jgi:hypothetical protein